MYLCPSSKNITKMINKNKLWLSLFLLGVIILVTTSCKRIEVVEKKILVDTITVIDTVIVEVLKEPIVTVFPIKTQVFYIGVDNPIEVNVLKTKGVVSVNVSQGLITSKGDGIYIVQVRNVGDATITIIVDGKIIGREIFRCKTVPDPVAFIGGKRGGKISKAPLLAQKYVVANLDNFVFDIKFPVVGFTVSATKDGFVEEISAKGNEITAEQKNLIRKLKSGDKVIFEHIKAQAPDGSIRNLGAVVWTLQ